MLQKSQIISKHFDDTQTRILLIVFLFTSCLAVLFQFFIMIFYLIFVDLKRPRNFSYRLIVILAFSDIVVWGMRIESNIERLASGHTAFYYSENYCVFLGVLWNFFLLLNILTTLVISSCLILEVFKYKSEEYEKLFYIIIIAYSLIFSFIPLVEHGIYGVDDDIKCWITDKYNSLFRYIGFYGHLWLVFIINCVNLCIILWRLRDLDEIPKKIVKKLIWFPLIMLVFWVEPSYRRIANSKDDDFPLALMQYIFMPMQGVSNAIVYGLVNPKVKEKLRYFLTGNCSNLFRDSTSSGNIDCQRINGKTTYNN